MNNTLFFHSLVLYLLVSIILHGTIAGFVLNNPQELGLGDLVNLFYSLDFKEAILITLSSFIALKLVVSFLWYMWMILLLLGVMKLSENSRILSN